MFKFRNKKKTPHTEEQKQSDEYWKKVRTERVPLNKELLNAGWDAQALNNHMGNVGKYDADVRNTVTKIMMKHSEYKYCSQNKEWIYRNFACCDWLKGDLRLEVIDLLFSQFEIEEMELNTYDTDDMQIHKSKEPYTDTDRLRWVIGLAISSLITPKLISHRKYKEKLYSLLHDKKYNMGRSELVKPYARISKEEAVPDLIKFLGERELLQSSIFELGKLRAIDARPYLENLFQTEEPFFRDLAKTALKKINSRK